MPPRPTRIAAVVATLVLLSGCDTVSPEPDVIILTREVTSGVGGSSIRFGFDSDTTPTGRSVTVRCGCSVDLAPYLATQGFSKADIVNASVREATLVMLFPISEHLDFLDSAVLRLEAAGTQAVEVASSTSFPDTREAALTAASSRDIAALVSAESFEPVLVIDAAALQSGKDYELGISITIRVEVQGF